jgi:hypothetical protein
MITLFIIFLLLTILFGIGFKITGALLAVAIWLFIKLPFAFITFMIGFVCCCTIILIPIGLGCFKAGMSLLMPRCVY